VNGGPRLRYTCSNLIGKFSLKLTLLEEQAWRDNSYQRSSDTYLPLHVYIWAMWNYRYSFRLLTNESYKLWTMTLRQAQQRTCHQLQHLRKPAMTPLEIQQRLASSSKVSRHLPREERRRKPRRNMNSSIRWWQTSTFWSTPSFASCIIWSKLYLTSGRSLADSRQLLALSTSYPCS